jgi:peptidoglycan/LPS O-acetylase OafA/YrhL
MIVILHAFESHSVTLVDPNAAVEAHGYLTVDFFFCLSGYVTAYAYDDRWDKLTFGNFVKRRLIRLHPLVLAGMVLGAVCHRFQACALFPLVREVSVWRVLLVMLIGMTMVPVPPSMDVRGTMELYPLDGPAWTLFYEYVANVVYALFLKKISNGALGFWTAVAAVAVVSMAVVNPKGDLAGGWSLEPFQMGLGFTRLAYPFLIGVLLFRVAKPIRFKRFPFWCFLLFVGIVACPRIGDADRPWINGLYDAFMLIVVLPIFVLIAAGAEVRGAAIKACRFAGGMSYPIYLTHYPFMLIYTAWSSNTKPSVVVDVVVAAFVCVFCVGLGYVFLRWYDIPVRAWLQRKFLV